MSSNKPNSSIVVMSQDVVITCVNPVSRCPLHNMADHNPCIQYSAVTCNGVLDGRLTSCVGTSAWDMYSDAVEICNECIFNAGRIRHR
ncbi:MAG: hypothetical protein K2L95_02295 [Alphaproteobacteria bacterium]|nr:hypothetical protein [Alphaproteobacteria bacterium]